MVKIQIDEKLVGGRVDKIVVDILQEEMGESLLSRGNITSKFDEIVTVNEKTVKRSYKVKLNDVVQVDLDVVKALIETIKSERTLETTVKSEKGELDIIYECSEYMILNKPHGLVVHPGSGNATGTLANYIKWYLMDKGEYDERLERSGIVHRLDRGVGGLMVVAKKHETQMYLKSLFETHQVEKLYLGRVYKSRSNEAPGVGSYYCKADLYEKLSKGVDIGSMLEWKDVDGYIGRDPNNRIRMKFQKVKGSSGSWRSSLTKIAFLEGSEALIWIKTGRKHQIRASLSYLDYFLEGDGLYGPSGDYKKHIHLDSVYLSFVDQAGEKMKWVIEK